MLVEFVVRGVVVVESKGSRLERTEPGSDTGSWGRQATRVRRMETGMLDRSRLSMCMVPFLRLRRRRRARRVEDLPLRTGDRYQFSVGGKFISMRGGISSIPSGAAAYGDFGAGFDVKANVPQGRFKLIAKLGRHPQSAAKQHTPCAMGK